MQFIFKILVFFITIKDFILYIFLLWEIYEEARMTIDELKAKLAETDPKKIIVDINEFETNEHQTYKWLFDNLNEKYKNKIEELNSMVFEKQTAEREASESSAQIFGLNETIEKLTVSNTELLAIVDNYVTHEIIVTDIEVTPISETQDKIHSEQFVKSISGVPGIYGGKRPGWFILNQQELTKENIKKKNTKATFEILKDGLLFWKQQKGKQRETVASNYEKKRKNNILELLQSSCSNQEKYLKYLLLTPGLGRDYEKTLQGASDMGLDANLVIALLEQPSDWFNKEIIEMYVSEVHRGTEYNLKQELAEELVKGQWSILAKVNGKNTKFQLMPIEEIDALKTKMESVLSNMPITANTEVCANLAQTSVDNHKNVESIDDYIPTNEDYSSVIQFDDSMLN